MVGYSTEITLKFNLSRSTVILKNFPGQAFKPHIQYQQNSQDKVYEPRLPRYFSCKEGPHNLPGPHEFS